MPKPKASLAHLVRAKVVTTPVASPVDEPVNNEATNEPVNNEPVKHSSSPSLILSERTINELVTNEPVTYQEPSINAVAIGESIEVPIAADVVLEFSVDSINEVSKSVQQTTAQSTAKATKLCKCGHIQESHDYSKKTESYTLCNEDECDCVAYSEIEYDPSKVKVKLTPSDIVNNGPLGEQIIRMKASTLEIAHTIPSDVDIRDESGGINLKPKYLDIDLEKLDEGPDPDLSPEDNWKNLTADELEVNEIARDYGTTKSEQDIIREQMARTSKAVENCSIMEIDFKIKQLEVYQSTIKGMIQGCVITRREKAKLETPSEKEIRLKKSKELVAEDNKKIREGKMRTRSKYEKDGPKVDRFGVIKQPPLSKREKFIKKMMSLGVSREKAEREFDKG